LLQDFAHSIDGETLEFWRSMAVSLRHYDAGVARDFRNAHNIRTALKHPGESGMSAIMKTDSNNLGPGARSSPSFLDALDMSFRF